MAALKPPASPMGKSKHTKSFKRAFPPNYDEAHSQAVKEAPGSLLTDFKIGKRYSIFIKTILERVDNIMGAIELNKLANKLKIALITRRILNSYTIDEFDETDGLDDLDKYSFEHSKRDAEYAVKEACKEIDDIYEMHTLPAKFMSNDPKMKLPDITKDCNGETDSPITLMKLIQGQSVILKADGKCYNFDDLIGWYKSKNGANMVSPMTRAPIEEDDMNMMRMLVNMNGGKKTKHKRKRNKTKRR